MKKIKIPTILDNAMWDVWMSTYHLPVVSVAHDLEVFSCIDTHNGSTMEQLSQQLGISKRSVEILVGPLSGLGFLINKKHVFNLSAKAKNYLLRESQFYWGPILEGFRNHNEYKKIMEAVKIGSNQLLYGDQTYTDMWKQGSITPEAAFYFTKKMHATIFAPAVAAIETGLFKDTKALLDVGGGSGCFSIAYADKYPEYTATIFELPVVCDIAKQYIHEYNLANRVLVHPGDFFNIQTWPSDHDGVLLSQIMHDWPEEQCKIILKNAYDALPLGGKLYIHEMLLNTSRTSPLTTSCFDLLMFINHQSQQFTKNKLFKLLRSVGFKMPKMEKTFGYYSLVIAKK